MNLICEKLISKMAWNAPWLEFGAFTAHSRDQLFSLGDFVSGIYYRLPLRISGVSADYPNRIIGSATGSGIWYDLLQYSLLELESRSDADMWSHEAWIARAGAVARSVFDIGGQEQVSTALATLRNEYLGGTFDIDDFHRVFAEQDIDVTAIAGDWLSNKSLPGFVVSMPTIELRTSESGSKAYSVRVHVHNTEETPGVVRLSLGTFFEIGNMSDPVLVPGIASVEIVYNLPTFTTELNQLWLHPTLSLNRHPIRITLPPQSQHIENATYTPSGAHRSSWIPQPPTGVVVDDLDPGFSIQSEVATRLRKAISTNPRMLDQGLPIDMPSIQAGEWHRLTMPAWGKHRQTLATAVPGNGLQDAVFIAELPEPGHWILDFHIPDSELPFRFGNTADQKIQLLGELGVIKLRVVFGDKEETVLFNAKEADIGWNFVDEFEIEEAEVRVVVSNETDGEVVIADAIRFRPVEQTAK